MSEDDERLKGLDTCKILVWYILSFGIDHINTLKVKEIRVLFQYHFGSEKLKGVPNKVDLWSLLMISLERIGRFLSRRAEGGVCCI